MKRLLTCLFVLALAIPTAYADLFPDLSSTPAPQAAAPLAPSYGAMANVDPDEVIPYAAGGQVVLYRGVDLDGYAAFGEYLESMDFEVTASEVDQEKGIVQMMLANGEFNLGMVYDAGTQEMRLIYDEGVDFAKANKYPGYTPIYLGDQIEIAGIGRFRFTKFDLNGEYRMCWAYSERLDGLNYVLDFMNGEKTINTRLLFEYTNTAPEQMIYGGYPNESVNNELCDMALVFSDQNNQYSVSPSKDALGRYYPDQDAICTVNTDHWKKYDWLTYYDVHPILPSESVMNGVAFNISKTLRFSAGERRRSVLSRISPHQ